MAVADTTFRPGQGPGPIAAEAAWWRWGNLRRWPIIQGVMIAVFIIVALFGPWLAPVDPLETNLRERLVPPAWMDGGSAAHLLGTDSIGRDIFSRIIVGARASFIVAIAALAFGSIMRSLIGLAAGYFGGNVDSITMRIADGFMAFPLILAALLLRRSHWPRRPHCRDWRFPLFCGRDSPGSSVRKC